METNLDNIAPQLVQDQNSVLAANVSRWAVGDSAYWGVTESTENMPGGLYRCAVSSTIGPYFKKQENTTDSILLLPDSYAETVVNEIKEFSSLKPEFDKRGFVYKRGILLWGPPGSGKTCTIKLLIDMVISKMDGIAIYIDNPYNATQCFQLLRKIEKDRQVIAIFEDLDELVKQFNEAEYLSLLDGESQIENIIFVATTNYPEVLDKRFKNRPSRFDTVHYIGMPNSEARAAYLKYKEPDLTEIEIKRFVAASENYSVAHLKELLILTKVFGKSLECASERISVMIEKNISSQDTPDRPNFGFMS